MLILLLSAVACVAGHHDAQKSTPADTIREVLCDIDKHDYQSALKKLESLPESDQKNANVRKLLVALQVKMIKTGDKTAENTAQISTAIEGYKRLLTDLPLTPDEKRQVNSSILHLYGQLGEEELKKELLSRSSDLGRPPSERAEAFVILAAKSWDCSFKITSNKSKDASEIARAKACVTDGLGYSNQALTLEPENEAAWSYKTNLLKEASTIADLEGRQTEKVSYQKQYDEALKRTAEVSKKAEATRETASEAPAKNNPISNAADRDAQELVEFKAENSLDKVASELLPIQIELTSLLAPMNGASESASPTTSSRAALPQQKHEWKTLTAAEDFTVDLPDNVSRNSAGYTASSEGVIYSIMSTNRTAIQAHLSIVDGVMNTIARTYTGFVSRHWLDGGLGNTFELKFLQKGSVNNEPRKLYAYSLRSCGENRQGVLVVQATQYHFYTIDISGANDSDTRVQRLLGSIKVR